MLFAVISDPQVSIKKNLKNKGYINKIKKKNPEFVLFPGDLTSHGRNKNIINLIGFKLRKIWNFIRCSQLPYDFKLENELDLFKEQFIEPIEKLGIKTYSVMGNHDTYTGPILPVKKWIKKKHNGTYYKINYSKYIDIYGLHIYPSKKICDWLKKNISNKKYNIIFFHYPLKGPYSREWDDKEKQYFKKTINKLKINLICHGHHHISETYKWNNIRVINAAGKKICFVNLDIKNKKLDIEFI